MAATVHPSQAYFSGGLEGRRQNQDDIGEKTRQQLFLLPIAYSLFPIAYSLFPIASSLLPIRLSFLYSTSPRTR